MTKVVNAHTQALEAASDHADSFQATRFFRDNRNDDDDDHGRDSQYGSPHSIETKPEPMAWYSIFLRLLKQAASFTGL